MSTKQATSGLVRHDSDASQREQALCLEALDSGKFDTLSDAEWVALCERTAREAAVASQS